MPDPGIHSIVLFGAGNFATNLALALKKKGYDILQVYNRTAGNGNKLAEKAGAVFINDLSEVNTKADLYIISVRDSAIEMIAGQLHLKDKIIVHTSGSMDISILQKASSNFGVLHSPQTFSKTKPISFNNLYIDIQANNKHCEGVLVEFAKTFCKNVIVVTAEQRIFIHVAAVFAGNFTNFMYTIAEDILSGRDLPFELMQPIIKKTSENSNYKKPFTRQTGPAVRDDFEVIAKHMDILGKNNYPDYQKLYVLISDTILKYKKLHE